MTRRPPRSNRCFPPPLTLAARAVAWTMAWAAVGAPVHAGGLIVTGSPTFDPLSSTGFQDGSVPFAPGQAVNNLGTAAAWSVKYVVGSNLGGRAVRWDPSGAASELPNLGTDVTGYTRATAYAINDAAIVVGDSQKYSLGVDLGTRAVRWDAAGVATELGHLGADLTGYTESSAFALNPSGLAVGGSVKYSTSNTYVGSRAVRWDPAGIAPTELAALSAGSGGYVNAWAYAVNAAGATVGYSEKYSGGTNLGTRAVRWAAGGTVVTELGNLGVTGSYTTSLAVAINASGAAAGWAEKYTSSVDLGTRAVRWSAAGTTATELGALGTTAAGVTHAEAYALNDAGTVVGYSEQYASGTYVGTRAVRWDAMGSTATELGNLGTDGAGITYGYATAVNAAGTAVGATTKFVSGTSQGYHAAIWAAGTTAAIDLNDLGIVPLPSSGTWTLTSANALSPDGWISGEGTFLPAGAAPAHAYARLWVAQVGLGGNWLNTANVSNTWGRGANWSTGTPAIQRDASFSIALTYTVVFDQDATARQVTVSAGNVTFALANHNLIVDQTLSLGSGATLILSGGSAACSGLTLSGTGKLDLMTSNVLVHHGDFPTLRSYITTHSLTSSSLTGATAIALVAGADYSRFHPGHLFHGQPVVATDALVQYTYAGDANLDGKISLDDYLAIDAGCRFGLNGQGWAAGDFNYDGLADASDYVLIDYAYLNQSGPLAADPLIALHTQQLGAAYAAAWSTLGSAAVPEPASLSLLLLGGSLLLRRAHSRRAAEYEAGCFRYSKSSLGRWHLLTVCR